MLQEGETLQIGSIVTQIRRLDETRLTLWEPDMESLPVRCAPGVTRTLRLLGLQLSMLDSLGIPRSQAAFPSVIETAVTCNLWGPHLKGFFLERMEPYDEEDCGWFFGCLDEDHDHDDSDQLRVVSLYEAMLSQPEAQGFLAFPADISVEMEQGYFPLVMKEGQELRMVPGTYLDRALNGPDSSLRSE